MKGQAAAEESQVVGVGGVAGKVWQKGRIVQVG